jgi:hypothetical protein
MSVGVVFHFSNLVKTLFNFFAKDDDEESILLFLEDETANDRKVLPVSQIGFTRNQGCQLAF